MILSLLKGKFAVCRLEKSSPIPDWLKESTFCSISRTYDELSFVCSQESIPECIKCDRDWRCFQVEGPIPFNVTGVIASLTAPSLMPDPGLRFSTYDTDYFMVKDGDLVRARAVLESAGHTISPKIWA